MNMITQQISNGDFQLTHQGIALDGTIEDGKLLDGQHRLLAIIRAEVPVEMFVFEDVPPETFTVLDTGKRRSGGDVLTLAGEKDTMLLAATIRHVHLLRTMPSGAWAGSKSRITNNELMEIFRENPDGFRDAVRTGRNLGNCTTMIPTAGATAYFLTREAAPETPTGEWLDGLYSGANLGPVDPRLAFIKAMQQMRGQRSQRRTNTRAHVGIYIKAWNAWVANKPVKTLRLQKGEPVPKPVRIRFSE
ncbi:hypothetical protein [Streptomyces pinistramenti]|uniref:hypothetical protein n=1 Tax=Streptomyces pinistramenti TaxID=2884812 RepID=UPI001D05EC01|nr:hypothetical protein [Streptomyces pinistramenti]MCB5908606.1 hypothetical protein [Streptomyces pinistramenti]